MKARFANTDQTAKRETSRSGMKCQQIGFLFGATLLGALTGCVSYADRPHHARVYEQPQPVYEQTTLFVQADYVYYPSYQVYYSGNTRQYVYQDGRSWVSRPAPPRVSADVLLASPSVRVDFHDAPAAHHATVVKAYPKNWTPPGWNQGNKGGNKKDRKDRD